MIDSNYKDGDVILLRVKATAVGDVLSDWYCRGRMADLRVRRARTPGYAVIETKDARYATFLLRTLYDIKADYRRRS